MFTKQMWNINESALEFLLIVKHSFEYFFVRAIVLHNIMQFWYGWVQEIELRREWILLCLNINSMYVPLSMKLKRKQESQIW